MRKLVTFATAFITTGFASIVLAHGDHGVTPPDSVIHYLAEPMHVIAMVVTLAALAIAVRFVRLKAR